MALLFIFLIKKNAINYYIIMTMEPKRHLSRKTGIHLVVLYLDTVNLIHRILYNMWYVKSVSRYKTIKSISVSNKVPQWSDINF